MILTKGKISQFNIESYVDRIIESNQLEKLLLVVPTNRRLRYLKKKILNNFSSKPVSNIYIETISTLSNNLLSSYKSYISLSEAASTVLIKESVDSLDLSYFNAYSKGIPFGTLDKIKNVISEYKRHGISPARVRNEAVKLNGGEQKKAVDIANIYDLFLSKCKSLEALEIGDVYTDLLATDDEILFQNFKELYNTIEMVIFDGFDQFTYQEIKLINFLSKFVNHNLIISFDYSNQNASLFGHLQETHSLLSENGFNRIKDLTPFDQNSFRHTIRQNLFKHKKFSKSNRYKSNVHKCLVNSRLDEIEFIAKNIKINLLDRSVRPENICVAFNNIGKYASITRDIFSKYEIPFNLTDRIPLKSSQPIIAIINLLELVEHDFSFHDLTRVLSNGLMSFENVDLNNLITVSSKLKITRGLQNWEMSISDAISLLRYDDEISVKEKTENLERYRKAKKDIKKISSLLIPFQKQNNKSDFLSLLKKLLFQLELPKKIIENSTSKEEEFIKSITVFMQSLNEVLELIDNRDEAKKYSLHFYLDQLRTISNWARFNIKEKSDYGVLITSVNEIRGLKFDYLYLGGMCDGDFPTKYSPEIFFSGSFQKKEKQHQLEERFLFYQTLCAWNKMLFITIPQNDSESELIKSTFVNDIEKLFEFTEITDNYSDVLFTKQDILIAYAKDFSNEKLKKLMIKEGFDVTKILNNSFVREKRKKEPFEEYEYSGYISKENQELETYLNKYVAKQFSISQLETFAKCPFKFFTDRILNIKPIREPSEEAEPIELGNILHSILYDFYSFINKNNLTISDIGSPAFNHVKDVIFNIAEKKIAKLNLHSPLAFFEIEKIMGINGVKENSILYKFLIQEVSIHKDFSPKYFEISFGKFANSLENDFNQLQVGDIKLRGKIDRIDINEKELIFNVVDYKLKGRKPTSRDLTDGLSLQLPVYMMAAEQILDRNSLGHMKGNKMIIYSLDYREGNFGPIELNLSRKRNLSYEEINNLNEQQIALTKERLIDYYNSIKVGEFYLSPLSDRDSKVCNYCDYIAFCRKQEVFDN